MDRSGSSFARRRGLEIPPRQDGGCARALHQRLDAPDDVGVRCGDVGRFARIALEIVELDRRVRAASATSLRMPFQRPIRTACEPPLRSGTPSRAPRAARWPLRPSERRQRSRCRRSPPAVRRPSAPRRSPTCPSWRRRDPTSTRRGSGPASGRSSGRECPLRTASSCGRAAAPLLSKNAVGAPPTSNVAPLSLVKITSVRSSAPISCSVSRMRPDLRVEIRDHRRVRGARGAMRQVAVVADVRRFGKRALVLLQRRLGHLQREVRNASARSTGRTASTRSRAATRTASRVMKSMA